MASSARRLSCTLAVLAGTVALAALCVGRGVAGGEERTISFFHIHTNETLTVVYKKNGEYVPEALEKINWLMRDWRKNQVIAIDPKTIDIIWEMHEELGSKQPVNVICGYRSRDTNEMLRRTVGGQASQSQHITGKAVDITFPDVPLRQMRYSAMVRERGGVGYYPTSGVPFVHVDTARVRHWPRMPRDELALLFPSGHSQHEPADGGPISPADVRVARQRNASLVTEVAQYFDVRNHVKTPVMVADAGAIAAPPLPPRPALAVRPAKTFDTKMAVGAPVASDDAAPSATRLAPVSAPRLVAEPRPVDRPSQFTAVADADRSRLDKLVTLASLDGAQAVAPSGPSAESSRPVAEAPKPRQPIQLAALDPTMALAAPAAPVTDAVPPTQQAVWVPAPAFDEDHPEELSYRPFPLAPLLTASASLDDPSLATLVRPDAAKSLDFLDDEGSILPMRLRPGQQTAALLWAHEFRGEAVSLAELETKDPGQVEPNRVETGSIAPRAVKTTSPR